MDDFTHYANLAAVLEEDGDHAGAQEARAKAEEIRLKRDAAWLDSHGDDFEYTPPVSQTRHPSATKRQLEAQVAELTGEIEKLSAPDATFRDLDRLDRLQQRRTRLQGRAMFDGITDLQAETDRLDMESERLRKEAEQWDKASTTRRVIMEKSNEAAYSAILAGREAARRAEAERTKQHIAQKAAQAAVEQATREAAEAAKKQLRETERAAGITGNPLFRAHVPEGERASAEDVELAKIAAKFPKPSAKRVQELTAQYAEEEAQIYGDIIG